MNSSNQQIKNGDRIEILKEWMDAGEESLNYIAVSDEEKGRVDIQAQNSGLRFPPINTVDTHMIRKIKTSADYPLAHYPEFESNPIYKMILDATDAELENIKATLQIESIDFDGDHYHIDFDGLDAYGDSPKDAMIELIRTLDAGCGEYDQPTK